MEDRYLFRGKRIDNGEWVEGFLIKPRIGGYVNIMENPDVKGEMADVYEVDPSTICQCTGLKDKSGKLIWENDIVIVDSRMFVVHYYEPFAMYMLKSVSTGGGVNGMMVQISNSEVIGNKFDNPELLKE